MNLTFSWPVIAQGILSGIMFGGLFGLISIGLTLIWGTLKIVNFAHGEFLMVAMYLCFFLVTGLGMDPYVTILITVPFLFVFGVLVFQSIIKPVIRPHLRDASMAQIMLTLGLSLMLQNLALVFFSANIRSIKTWTSTTDLAMGSVVVSYAQIIAFVGSLIGTAALWFFLRRTDYGRAIRAAAQNKEAAGLVGINVKMVYLVAFGLGSATLGLAGPLMMPFYYAAPTVGIWLGVVAFIVVVLGGWGNILGAFVGGIIVGLTEALGAAMLPGSLARMLTFTVFILFLLFKPEGVLARRGMA